MESIEDWRARCSEKWESQRDNALCATTLRISRFRVSGFGFRVSGFRFRVSGFRFRVSGFRSRVSGLGFQVWGFGSRVSSWKGYQGDIPTELLLEKLFWRATPYTLHPTPYTLHPTPYTLHPKPPFTLSCR